MRTKTPTQNKAPKDRALEDLEQAREKIRQLEQTVREMEFDRELELMVRQVYT